ncbi:MAG: hypothetical protein AB1725_05820 [Armatimonadota bacterium]
METQQIYQNAVTQYRAGNKDLAYKTFGHVLHLVSQDMYSAPHAHNDVHFTLEGFGGPTFAPNSYETWTTVHINDIRASPLHRANSVPEVSGTIGDILDSNAQVTYRATRIMGNVQPNTSTPATGEIANMFPPTHNQRIIYIPLARCAVQDGSSCLVWEAKWELTGVGDCFEFTGCAAAPGAGDEWWITQNFPSDPPGARFFYIEDSAVARPANYRGMDSGNRVLAELWALGHPGVGGIAGEQLIAKGQAASAALMRYFAQAVDGLEPKIELHRGDQQGALIEGALIPNNGFTNASKVFIHVTDPRSLAYPAPSGVFRLVLKKTDAPQSESPVEFALGNDEESHLFENLTPGQYEVEAFDGLGNRSLARFRIVTTPPTLLLVNEYGERMDHGSYSDSALITIAAAHNPAPVKSLEFFVGNAPAGSMPVPEGKVDISITRRFSGDSWHYVRACDVALNCVYSLFGVFPPGTTPPNPPGPPPSPGSGGTQRPNPKPGQPLPPPDDPDNPPPPPTPSPPGPPTPPVCKGEGCLNEPPAEDPPWDPEPKVPKFCQRTPQNCNIPIAFPHDPNAKYGPSGSVVPGQLMTYTIEFENEGDGTALGTYVRDPLDPALDETTLVLRDMRRVNFLTEVETSANFPWSFDPRTRVVTLQTGDAESREGGRFILEARLKSDTTPGTIIGNQAIVYFPTVLEVTPTNSIVSAVPFASQLIYEGASSATYLATTRFAARLTAGGKPLVAQPVEFLLAGSSWTGVTDASGVAAISTAIAVLPGVYSLQVRYAGDGFLYLAQETSNEFVIEKRRVRVDAPFAAARSTETARVVVVVTDDEGHPLSAQADDPKTIHLELLSGEAVTPLATELLSGTSVSFAITLPQPLKINWSVRTRFDGDMRYASAVSTGVLRLVDETLPTITIHSPTGGQVYASSQLIPIDFSTQDSEDPTPASVGILTSSAGFSVPVADGDSVAVSSLSPGQWSLRVQATDWAGNQAETQGEIFRVLAVSDNLAPRTNLNVGGPQFGTTTIFITTTTLIGFSASDDLTTVGDGIGAGVERTEYSLDGGTSAVFVEDFAVSTEGAHSLSFFSADFAGNIEAPQVRALFVDTTSPITRLLVGGLPVATTDVTLTPTDGISFSTTDAGSGVAIIFYEVDGATASTITASTFTLSVGTHSLSFYSVDNLGNTEAAQTAFLTVRNPQTDVVAPLVRLDFPGTTGREVEQAVGGIVSVRGAVTDESGVNWVLEAAPGAAASTGFTQIAAGGANVTGVLAAWNTVPLSGHFTLRLRAVDVFDNASSVTAAVFVGKPVFNFAIGRKDSHVIVNQLKNPSGIAARPDGLIWVSVENDRLLLLSSTGAVIAQLGRQHGHGHDDDDDDEDDDEDGGDDGDGLRFSNPRGLAVDASHNLYVADKGRNRVLKLSPDGSQILLQLARLDHHGRPKSGSGPGEFKKPWDVAVDGNGDIYAADSGNGRIQVFNSSGTFLRQFGQAVLRPKTDVRGIALTGEGLWVSDKEQERVHLFSRAGVLIKSIGDADSAVGELSRMRGLASDHLGALYVVEPNRDRTQKFDPQGKGLLAFGTKDGLSQADKQAKRYLTQPIDAAVAPDGSIWITDTGRDRIVRYALPVSGGYGVAAYSTGGGEGIASSSVEPAKRVVDHKDGAKVERDDGAGVMVPKGALSADLEITVDKGDENEDKEQKEAKRKEKKVAAVSEEVQYGPEGTTFSTPVTLTIPYDPALIASRGIKEESLKVYYWNPTLKDWEAMPSTVDKTAKTVSAQTSHFSSYQIGGLGGIGVAALDDFGLRDGYAFPNPSRNGASVTFRLQPGSVDSIEVRVYDVSGRKIHSSSDFRFRGAIDDGNGKGAQNTYDHIWDVSGVGSGVYTYVMTAKKAGQTDIRKTGKVGVIR